jgi:hypothetical protein
VRGNAIIEGIVLRVGTTLRVKTLDHLIGQRRCLCMVAFPEASFLESLDFRCCLGGGYIVDVRAEIPSGTFFFLSFLFLFLAVCIRTTIKTERNPL